MGTNMNRVTGLRFETEICKRFAEHGFWAHDMTQNAYGQPADVIAVKDGTAVLMDCKLCMADRFKLVRVEANQQTAMQLWTDRGNLFAYFVIRFGSGATYMVSWKDMKYFLGNRKVVITEEDCRLFCLTLEAWLEIWEGKIQC